MIHTLRKAQASDFKAVKRIAEACAPALLPNTPMMYWLGATHIPGQLWVALHGESEQVKGFAWLLSSKQEGQAWLHQMAVDPDFQDQGIGSLLMSRVLAESQKVGYRQIGLAVHQQNPIRKWYEKLGFQSAEEPVENHQLPEGYLMLIYQMEANS